MTIKLSDLIGTPLNSNLTLIAPNKVLDKSTGGILSLERVVSQPSTPSAPVVSPPEPPVEIKKEIEVVVGVDGKKIDLSLASSEGEFEPIAGFLIEVYLSGTDGTLTRVYQEDVVDALNDDTLSEGFSHYLKLEVDK